MPSVFEGYAHFYDTYYQQKDYPAECEFLKAAFGRFSDSPVESILDLGCGTGGHLIPLAEAGYSDLAGVDRSEVMLSGAREKAQARGLRIAFHQGDIRSANLGRTFDAVVCMFAVMCYQISNSDLEDAIRTARSHLNAGGIFVFDGWFGPGVLTDPPVPRFSSFSLPDGSTLLRFAEPSDVDTIRNSVDIRYRIIHLREREILDCVEETHTMRFLFVPEIAYYLEKNGFELAHLCVFPDLDQSPSKENWQIAAIGKAI